MIFLYRKDDGKGDFSVNEAEKSSFFVYASSEKNRMLACRFGEHRDNSRNSQSVFLVVYGKIKDEIILKRINRDCCGCNSPFFALQEIAFL